MSLDESVVEQAALAWLQALGWQVRNGADIAPSELRVKEAERAIKETTV
jgi:type I restriction enzyme R subunit